MRLTRHNSAALSLAPCTRHATKQRVRNESEEWKLIIGDSFADQSTDWDAARTAARWLQGLRAFGYSEQPAPIRQQLESEQRA